MPRALLATTLCLALSGPAFAVGEPDASSLLTVGDRWGNTISVTNRYDGRLFYVEVMSFSRSGGINWTRPHYDNYTERANAANVDSSGNIYIAGVRVQQGAKSFWLIKFSQDGNLLWERSDAYQDCTGMNVIANEAGDSWVGGSCIRSDGYPVHIVHYDAYGSTRWGQFYNGGGRNYMRGLSLDFNDRLSVSVEIRQGDLGGGSSYGRTVVYDPSGGQVTVY